VLHRDGGGSKRVAVLTTTAVGVLLDGEHD